MAQNEETPFVKVSAFHLAKMEARIAEAEEVARRFYHGWEQVKPLPAWIKTNPKGNK